MGLGQRIVTFLDPDHFLGALALAGVMFVAGIILSRLLSRAFAEMLEHARSEGMDQIRLSFLSHLLVLALWILLAIIYAHLVPALHRLGTALLAGVGLISIVTGLAAQTTLGNLISGVSLVLYKPFRRGDRLQLLAPSKDGFEIGIVEDITLGFTILCTDDGRDIIVSNVTIAQKTMIKLISATKPDGHGRSFDAACL
jgi:small-conductance mechanosensitive channel